MWFQFLLAACASGFFRRRLTRRPQRPRRFRPSLEALETRLTPSLTTLASFAGPESPYTGDSLVMDSSGNLYGTTAGTSATNDGTVFELAQGSGTLTTLATFNGTNGAQPRGALVMDSSGNLYGTTFAGGASNHATVFELAQGSGTITTLASFNVAAAVNGLVMDSSGNFYGTTGGGGGYDEGTVFELVHGSRTITTLASFNGTDGAGPIGALTVDSSANLYGTTELGGPSYVAGNPPAVLGDGTVFELVHGSRTITTLTSFNGANGEAPAGGLITDSSGNLYGTTDEGGVADAGTVFELAKGSSGAFAFTTLASFGGYNGEYPHGGLIMDSSGNLYGTTYEGGAYGSPYGTVFGLAHGSGGITTLAYFTGPNGFGPEAGLIMDSSGDLYGTTTEGGPTWNPKADHYGDGIVFELPGAVAETSFQISSLPASTSAGTAQAFTVTVQTDGTTDTAYTGTVQFTSSDPQAVLPANYTFTAANAGVATFTATLKTAGTQAITAADTANSFLTGSGTITVTPAAASSLTIGGFPSPATAGSAANVTVTALDAFGNIATGYTGTVHLTSSDAKAVLPASYTFTATDAGKHVFAVTLKTAGTQSLTATDTVTPAMTSPQTGITVNPAAASVLVITGPASAMAGVAFSITVTAYDAYGNVATGYTGTVHFTSSDSTARLPAKYVFVAANAGTHTFTTLVLKKKGNESITATDTLTNSITGSLTVDDS